MRALYSSTAPSGSLKRHRERGVKQRKERMIVMTSATAELDVQHVDVVEPLLVDLGNAADMTLGGDGTGRENKRRHVG